MNPLPPPPGEPTPEEIAADCRAIREEWDAETERKRAGAPSAGWAPPECKSVIGEPEAEAA